MKNKDCESLIDKNFIITDEKGQLYGQVKIMEIKKNDILAQDDLKTWLRLSLDNLELKYWSDKIKNYVKIPGTYLMK